MQYDIVIVGGGMVGAALACSLQNKTLRIALMDNALNHTEDKRLIALNHSSYVLLKNIGIWPSLKPYAFAIQKVHVSHRGHFGTTSLSAKELNKETLGYVVPAKEITAALYARIAETKNIELFRPATLLKLTAYPDDTDLTFTHETFEKNITTKWLIGADGTHSSVREMLSIETDTFDYHQSALVTITELQRHHSHTAYERFLTEGAIAMLPLTEHSVATIWTDHEKTIEQLQALSDREFLHALQTQFGYRLGRLKAIKTRFVYPLKRVMAKEQIKQRNILVGNAAHTIHPIAAQGLNVALYEIAVLADHFNKIPMDVLFPADFLSFLKNINLSHYLSGLFSTDFFPINQMRQVGLIGFDLCVTAKRSFVKEIFGKASSRTPSLLKETS
ncbi:MAG: hypothetical protein ACD_60C00030G0009 [uncultured bacterium]|nr:MAG: hypothetical protein ACD_60C00030G0009 [uncultured bacterium]